MQVAAEIEESGRVLVSGRLLADIASRLPNAPVVFSTEDSRITVSCGSAHFTLLSMPVDVNNQDTEDEDYVPSEQLLNQGLVAPNSLESLSPGGV